MLLQQFNWHENYKYIRYARMSSNQQNPTSPDQQFDTINHTLQGCGYGHWEHLQDYRDTAVSGKVVHKRAGFQKMLFDIKSKTICPDLILVDDIDRFGRMDNINQYRADLYHKHGVLVLDSKSNFADPNGAQGRVYSVIEELRAGEEGRTKALRVMRGKREAVLQKHWNGGKPPFGYNLKAISEHHNGHSRAHSILIPNPETDWIVKLAFCKADETGWGQGRITRFLNNHSGIPESLKPFQASSVGLWFSNEIYVGIMVWPKLATDVINDCRVNMKVPEEDRIRVEDYCTPIVPLELFKRVFNLRKLRGEKIMKALAVSALQEDKLLAAPAPGMTLKYLLTGLVKCGHCHRSMVPAGTGVYITRDGKEKRYVAYFCSGSVDGNCSNRKRIPEQWLREVVVSTIRTQLFPAD